jgi:hypothetical protein
VHYFSCAYDILKLFQSDGELMQNDFLQQWRGMDAQHEQTKTLNVTSPDADSLNRIMKENNIFVVAQRQLQQNQTAVYASAKAPPSSILLMQCALSTNALHVTCRAQHIELAPILFASLERAFG